MHPLCEIALLQKYIPNTMHIFQQGLVKYPGFQYIWYQ